MSLVDIAGNLTNKAFKDDLPEILARAEAAGLSAIVVAGVSTTTSRRGWELAADRAGASTPGSALRLVATSGIHPHHAKDASGAALEEIASLAEKDLVVAVGECGLDYNRNFSPPADQRRAFEAQLEIAAAIKKPVYLHERDAHDDFTRILGRWRPKLAGGVVHCFTGDGAALDRYLGMDLCIGITGWICDERRGTHLRGLVARIPPGRLMVETDCPYILPRDLPAHERPARPGTERRNEPAFVAHVARTVAKHRGLSFEQLAAETTRAATRLFGL
jgi:TatD DNase family protein